MTVKPTLRCACKGCHLEQAFSYDAPPSGETTFDFKGQCYHRSFKRCTVCGHWFGCHDLDLSRLYHRDYVDATYGGSAGLRLKFEHIMALAPEKSDNRRRTRRICNFFASFGPMKTKPRNLLDVGAGTGVFPATMKEQGWCVTALETDPRTRSHLHRIVGIPTLDSDLHHLDAAAVAPFSLITFNKVLEHVSDPAAMLASAKALLLHQGLIYVEVPDVAAAIEGPEREEFFIEHLHIFSPASLANLLRRSDYCLLRLTRIREPSGKYTLYAFACNNAVHNPGMSIA